MDTLFIRNFVIFVFIMLLCTGLMSYGLIVSNQDLDKTDDWVSHIHDTINSAEKLPGLIEGMVSSQRGYILTLNENFLDEYETNQAAVSQSIAHLHELTFGNPSQQSRLKELQSYYNSFSQKLEERAGNFSGIVDPEVLHNMEVVDRLRRNISRINTQFLEEEYNLLDQRVKALESKKDQYFKSLLVGLIIGSTLLLILNGFLLHAQRKRSRTERFLKDTEKLHKLVIEGIHDGIFDWNLKTNVIFYSKQFFHMLGYEKEAFHGTVDDFQSLLHPEDLENVKNYMASYLKGEISEYSQEFRMKHKSGRWVWIQSRASSFFDKKGRVNRIVGVHTDITYLKKEQEKLKLEKLKAEESNQAKSEFLAHMSHEIRTPLTAISGIAEIFEKRQNNLDDKQKQLVRTLNSSTSGLKDLISDLLDFSKIENRELSLDKHSFPLENLFQTIISMMAMRASEKGISFIFDYDAVKETEFYGDDMRMRQILINLIGNAIKFTDTGGVSVRALYEDHDGQKVLRINVSDTGIGVSAEDFDMIFKRFKQADSSVSRRYGGTGLGLPISKNLAVLMDGDIIVSSALGEGSTFSLILPYQVAQSSQQKKKEKISGKKLDEKIRQKFSNRVKLMIAEDYEGNIAVLSYMLDDIGIDYDVVKTGVDAITLWEKNHYDLILMDIQMPEMDGFTATLQIREKEKEKNLSRTPIIGLTAHALVQDKDKCIAVGMDAYLPKPLVENDLKRKILKLLDEEKKAA